MFQPFQFVEFTYAPFFPNSEVSSPIPKTLLWNTNVRFGLFCALIVLKILCEKKKKKKKKKKKEKKYSCGTRNDPVFDYSNTSHICRLISKYLLLASQTNINIILQDFLYSFWVTTPLK